MAKLTLTPVTNLSSGSAVSAINENYDRIEAAFENVLSRDGDTPNQMTADIDLNSNDILNVTNLDVKNLTIDGVPAQVGVIVDALKTSNALSELTAFGLDDEARGNLGLTVGADVQAFDQGLQSISNLVTSSDQMIYTTASDAYATTSLTPFARTILDDLDAASVRATIGLSSAAPNVVHYGAIGDGVTPAQVAFGLAAAAATANITTTVAFSSMPQTPTAMVVIPAGVWHLTADVVVSGKQITWVVDEGAKFTSGSASRLLGKVVRPSRNSNSFPFGFLDAGTGDSVMIGTGSSDNSPLVSGFTNPNAISTVGTLDLVGRYTDATSMDLVHMSAATFTATTCTITTPVDVNRLRVGMVVQTTNTPYERGQITSWNSAGTVITVANGWYADGSTVATTPASASVIFNPFHKLWGLNTNTFLTATGYGFQSAGHEVGVWNDKVTPTIAEDSSGRTWGEDVVNLGPRKGSIAFIARGSFFEGYRATGTDIGFKSSAYTSLGYAKPTVGFEHAGGGVSYRARNSSDIIDFEVNNGLIELGPKGAAGNALIDFNVGAISADYDCRLIASGGDGVVGNGSMFSDSLITFSKNMRPITDNTYQLGGASNRWTVVFATTGTINTSDERLKRFLDAYDEAENNRIMSAAIRAIKKLPIRLYQWNSSLEEKGEAARLHFGVSAQDVEKVFISEGLNAHNFGLFCEDEEYDQVEVVSYIEVPETEEVEEEVVSSEMVDGKMVVSKTIKSVQKTKTVTVPMVYEDGSPVMKEVGAVDFEGNPLKDGGKLVINKEPVFIEVPVTKKKEVKTYKNVPNGKTRLGLRYDQLLLLYIKALEI